MMYPSEQVKDILRFFTYKDNFKKKVTNAF